MKKIIFLFTLLSFVAININAQSIEGNWKGELTLPNESSLSLIFKISKTGDQYSSTLSVPEQGAVDLPTTSTTFVDQNLKISISPMMATYEGKLDGDIISGKFVQGGMSFDVNLKRSEAIKLNRPQEPKAPYPYLSKDVVFRNEKAGINLAGTLTMPSTGSNFPAVVLITGSGTQNRDEEIMGHKPFLVIADYLTRHGIAVLRFDDRGAGESEGDPKTATSNDFATDVEAAVAFLKQQKKININKIGLLGHSEGGSIAFAVATNEPEDISFVVSLAGAAVKGSTLLLQQVKDLFMAQGMTIEVWKKQEPILQNRYALLTQDKTIAQIREELKLDVLKNTPTHLLQDEAVINRMHTEMEAMTSPWYINFLKHDPSEDLKDVKCPVFAINGDKDLQVNADMNLKAIESVLKANGNQHVEIKKYPNLNHLFQSTEKGLPQEYGQIDETVNPEVLNDVKNWILRTVK